MLNKNFEIMQKYPDRICIYLSKLESCKTVKELDKHKYLIHNTMIASEFIFMIRQKLVLDSSQALFFYTNNMIVNGNILLSNIYNKYKHEDGFLYMYYCSENTFG
jgi:GABA(A) receptor-associated protein